MTTNPTPRERAGDDFREDVIRIMRAAGLSREDSLTVLARVADRLDGYTHEESVRRNPLVRRDTDGA